MKKLLFLFIIVYGNVFNSTAQSYKAELEKINSYLRTFDNGYYGYLEIKDGYLYDRFKDGKNYASALIKDLDKAVEVEYKKKVVLKCKSDKSCVYSTYTYSNHTTFSFSQSADFNTGELISLLNNLITAYNNNGSDKYKSNSDISNNGSNQTGISTSKSEAQKLREQKTRESQLKNSSSDVEDDFWGYLFEDDTPTSKSSTPNPAKYTQPLKELNEYLKTFNSATYSNVEVSGKDVIFNFKFSAQLYRSTISISDLINNTTVVKGKSVGSFGTEEIKILCKNGSKCFYSTYSNSTTDHFRFFSNTIKDLTKMEQLVTTFINSLK